LVVYDIDKKTFSTVLNGTTPVDGVAELNISKGKFSLKDRLGREVSLTPMPPPYSSTALTDIKARIQEYFSRNNIK
jgi:hypothetical protein